MVEWGETVELHEFNKQNSPTVFHTIDYVSSSIGEPDVSKQQTLFSNIQQGIHLVVFVEAIVILKLKTRKKLKLNKCATHDKLNMCFEFFASILSLIGYTLTAVHR